MSDILKNVNLSRSALQKLLGKRNYQILFSIFVLAVLIFGPGFGMMLPEEAAEQNTESQGKFRVVRIIDGDTFEIEGGERVRLIGIDTPESVNPNASVECFGKEASAYLRDMIEGKTVRLERDVTDRDRYARLLRYAYLGDIFINEKIVREGYGESVAYKPDTAKQEVLRQAEESAREGQLGQWNSSACPKQ